jgi:uncharacterized protein (TIGR03503 family)
LCWKRIALAALLMCTLAVATPISSAAPAHAALDVRILVDVSQSGQRADRQAARSTMVNQLIDLLPTGSRAGIWIYGEDAQALVSPGTVDSAWREAAHRASARIDASSASASPRADFFAGLYAATASWRGNVLVPAERHVIVIGNGDIDVPGGTPAIEASRDRIVQELFPLLQQVGAAAHSIALSTSAKHALLAELSAASGGQRISLSDEPPASTLLRLYEQAMRPLMLPIHGNEIIVDSDISQLTVLAVKRPDTAELSLRTPAGPEFEDNSQRAETGYEVIVVERPVAGTWHFDGPASDDVRALINSDLNLAAGPLPARVFVGENMNLRAGLLAYGRALDNKALRHTLRLRATYPGIDGLPVQTMLRDDGRGSDAAANDGIYTLDLPAGLPAGQQSIRLEADGTIFERLRYLPVEVVTSPVTTIFEHTERSATLYILPHADLVRPDSVHAEIEVSADGEHAGRYTAVRHAPNEWRIDLADFMGRGLHELALTVNAERVKGGELNYQEAPRRFSAAGLEDPRPKEEEEEKPADEIAPSAPAQHVGLAILLGSIALGSLLLTLISLKPLIAGPKAHAVPAAATTAAAVYASGIVESNKLAPVAAVADPAPAQANVVTEITEETETPTTAATRMDAIMAEIAADAAAQVNPKLKEKVERATKSASTSDLSSNDPLLDIDVSEIDLDFNFDEEIQQEAV